MRNHGENPLHTVEAHSWEIFLLRHRGDFHGIRTSFRRGEHRRAFHSLASIATLGAYAAQPQTAGTRCACSIRRSCRRRDIRCTRFRTPTWKALARVRCARQEIYDSPEQLAALFRRRASFGRWVPEGADLLARHTLASIAGRTMDAVLPASLRVRCVSREQGRDVVSSAPRNAGPLMIIAGDPAFAPCESGRGDREIGA